MFLANKSMLFVDVIVTSSYSQRLPWRAYDDNKSVDGMYAYGQDVCKDVYNTEGRNPCRVFSFRRPVVAQPCRNRRLSAWFVKNSDLMELHRVWLNEQYGCKTKAEHFSSVLPDSDGLAGCPSHPFKVRLTPQRGEGV